MQVINLEERKAHIKEIERNFDFAAKCREVSEELTALSMAKWNIDIRETENQLRVDFLDFANEHPFFVTTLCKDKQQVFDRLMRKIESMKFLGGAA